MRKTNEIFTTISCEFEPERLRDQTIIPEDVGHEGVGLEFAVTLERIRQIEAKTLRKLRHPGRSRKLRGYLEE